jgi:hypothetical protein
MTHPIQSFEIQIVETIYPMDETWFEPYSIQAIPPGGSILTGNIIDQSELYGLLNRLHDFNLSLVSVQIKSNQQELK